MKTLKHSFRDHFDGKPFSFYGHQVEGFLFIIRVGLTCIFIFAICLMLSGCELAGLDAAALGEAGEAAALGDASALSRVAGADGAVISESDAVALRSAATSRTPSGLLGIQGASSLSEEVAIIRSSARILSYPESYPLARNRGFTVTFPNGSPLASFRRFNAQLEVRNGSGHLVGESIFDGNKILHYTDSTRTSLRGYTVMEGSTLKHWIYDRTGNPIYYGSETVQTPPGMPPDTIVIPAALLAAIQHQSSPTLAQATSTQPGQRQVVHTPMGDYLPLGGYPVLPPAEAPPPAPSQSRVQAPTQARGPFHGFLRLDGEILEVHSQGIPTVVWSNGYVDVWADDSPHHRVLAPGHKLNFPNSYTIHAVPRSDGATELFYQPSHQPF